MKNVILLTVLLSSFLSMAQIHNASGTIKTKSAIEFTSRMEKVKYLYIISN